MSTEPIFATLLFAGSESTLGMALVCDAIKERVPTARFVAADPSSAKHADFLLVSLCWWRDVYAFVRFLWQAGIDPRKPRPHILIGGMSATNPRPIRSYAHGIILGDGEAVVGDYVDAVLAGKQPDHDGLWRPGMKSIKMAYAKALQPKQYVDLRKNKTTRIEIARGCRFKCPFCQLSGLKPYRELPFEIARHLVMTAPTKTVSLFAPDRTSYSRFDDLEECALKAGKTNTGSDVRLETMLKRPHAEKVRFGVEGFAEKTRRYFRKVASNKILVDGLVHIANDMTTRSGKPLTTAIVYMMADLPGEDITSLREFWGQLDIVNSRLKRRFSVFVSVAAFTPKPYTPMERVGIDPYTPFAANFKATLPPRADKLSIIQRGGCMSAAQRLSQMLTIRGDERARRALFYLSTQGYGLTRSTKPSDARKIERVVAESGFPPEDLYRELPEDYELPWPALEEVSA